MYPKKGVVHHSCKSQSLPLVPWIKQILNEADSNISLALIVLALCTVFYRKFPKYSDTQKICCNPSKIWTMWLYHRVMSPNDADGMANSVDPDQLL